MAAQGEVTLEMKQVFGFGVSKRAAEEGDEFRRDDNGTIPLSAREVEGIEGSRIDVWVFEEGAALEVALGRAHARFGESPSLMATAWPEVFRKRGKFARVGLRDNYFGAGCFDAEGFSVGNGWRGVVRCCHDWRRVGGKGGHVKINGGGAKEEEREIEGKECFHGFKAVKASVMKRRPRASMRTPQIFCNTGRSARKKLRRRMWKGENITTMPAIAAA